MNTTKLLLIGLIVFVAFLPQFLTLTSGLFTDLVLDVDGVLTLTGSLIHATLAMVFTYIYFTYIHGELGVLDGKSGDDSADGDSPVESAADGGDDEEFSLFE